MPFLRGNAPKVTGLDGCRNRSTGSLREADSVDGRMDMALMQAGIARMREHLIDGPSRHDVSAQEEPNRFA